MVLRSYLTRGGSWWGSGIGGYWGDPFFDRRCETREQCKRRKRRYCNENYSCGWDAGTRIVGGVAFGTTGCAIAAGFSGPGILGVLGLCELGVLLGSGGNAAVEYVLCVRNRQLCLSSVGEECMDKLDVCPPQQ